MTDDRDQRIDALRGLAQEGAQPNILPSRDIGAQPAAPRRSRKALLLLYYPLLKGAQIWGSRDLPR
ncbi:MAG TPA: hypothetical protein VJO13_18570 [Ktedonobacterales bacterium]|nr:hypothetical protein [Ktedonobacterales bacterium]